MLRDTTPATGRHQIMYLRFHPHPVPGCGKSNGQLITALAVVIGKVPCPWFATETDSKAPDPVLFYLVTATRQDIKRLTKAILGSRCFNRDTVDFQSPALFIYARQPPQTIPGHLCHVTARSSSQKNVSGGLMSYHAPSLFKQTRHRWFQSHGHVSNLKTHKTPLRHVCCPKARAPGEW